MDRGAGLGDDEERALRRCPILFAPSGSVDAAELTRLGEQLAEQAFVLVRDRRLVAEYAHAHVGDYPGGVCWVSHLGSEGKEVAADVVEALELPTSCWLHWPFVGGGQARSTMWRGLRGAATERGQSLVVIDAWPPWASVEHWNAADGCARVIAIAHPERESAPLTEAERGEVVRRCESLSPSARRLVMALSCVGWSPLLASTLQALWPRVTAGADLEAAIIEVTANGLARRTVLGELVGEWRELAFIREQAGSWSLIYEAIVTTLVEELSHLEVYWVHKSRRLVANARFASWALEKVLAPKAFDALLAAISRSPRNFEATEAAKKRLDLATKHQTMSDEERLETLLALGHAQSNGRDLVDAQSTLREALVVAERVHGADSLEVVGVLDALARSIGLGACGAHPPEYLEIRRRSVAILERAWGADDPRLEHALWSLGLALGSDGLREEALPVLERAVAMAEQQSSRMLASYIDSITMMLAELGRIDEALASADRALAVYRQTDVQFASSALIAVRQCLETSGRLDELIARIDAVLSWPGREATIDEDERDELDKETAKLHAMRAKALAKLGRDREASDAAMKALPVYERLFDPASKRVQSLRALCLEANG